MANFNVDAFWRVLLAHSVAMWTFEALAEFLAVAFSNPFCGMGVGLVTWFAFFLVSGVFISESSIHWPARVLMYASPFRWTLPGLVYCEFNGTSFAPPDPKPGALAYGETGEQILTTLSRIFTIIEATDHYYTFLWRTAAIGGGFKLLFLVFIIGAGRGGRSTVDGRNLFPTSIFSSDMQENTGNKGSHTTFSRNIVPCMVNAHRVCLGLSRACCQCARGAFCDTG